jgi:acid stress chaperone HdeB
MGSVTIGNREETMKKIMTITLGLAFALAANAPATGQVSLDVAKITCWQFVTYKITNPQFIAVWISGYRHGKEGNTIIDPPSLVANATKMQEYCTKNPDVPLMQAVETVLGEKD